MILKASRSELERIKNSLEESESENLYACISFVGKEGYFTPMEENPQDILKIGLKEVKELLKSEDNTFKLSLTIRNGDFVLK